MPTAITRSTTGTQLGYARVRTGHQSLDQQLDALTTAGVDPKRVYTDKLSGTSTREQRPGLAALLDYARPGDAIVVVGIDRLGRNAAEVMTTIRELGERGIVLRSHDRARLLSVAQREARGHTTGAFEKQCHRSGVDTRAEVQRGHRPQLLVGDLQTLTAGGQNPHRRRVGQDGFDQVGYGVEHVLAVVEHQQPDSALQRGYGLADALARLVGDAQHRRHRIGHAAGSLTAASSKNQTPSGNSSTRRAD